MGFGHRGARDTRGHHGGARDTRGHHGGARDAHGHHGGARDAHVHHAHHTPRRNVTQVVQGVGPPPNKVTIVGKNEMYRWENLVGPFLVHKLLIPRLPLPFYYSPATPPSPRTHTADGGWGEGEGKRMGGGGSQKRCRTGGRAGKHGLPAGLRASDARAAGGCTGCGMNGCESSLMRRHTAQWSRSPPASGRPCARLRHCAVPFPPWAPAESTWGIGRCHSRRRRGGAALDPQRPRCARGSGGGGGSCGGIKNRPRSLLRFVESAVPFRALGTPAHGADAHFPFAMRDPPKRGLQTPCRFRATPPAGADRGHVCRTGTAYGGRPGDVERAVPSALRKCAGGYPCRMPGFACRGPGKGVEVRYCFSTACEKVLLVGGSESGVPLLSGAAFGTGSVGQSVGYSSALKYGSTRFFLCIEGSTPLFPPLEVQPGLSWRIKRHACRTVEVHCLGLTIFLHLWLILFDFPNQSPKQIRTAGRSPGSLELRPPPPFQEAPVRIMILQMHTPGRTSQCWSRQTRGLGVCIWMHRVNGTGAVSGTADPGVVKQDKSFRGLH